MRNKNRFLAIGILTCLMAFYLPCSAQENNKLYVGNLSSFMNEAELKALFVEFGTVTGVMVAIEKSSQRGRGFGTVTMSTPEAAAKAIKAKNGALVNAKNLIVRLLVTQEERSGDSRHGSGRTSFLLNSSTVPASDGSRNSSGRTFRW